MTAIMPTGKLDVTWNERQR